MVRVTVGFTADRAYRESAPGPIGTFVMSDVLTLSDDTPVRELLTRVREVEARWTSPHRSFMTQIYDPTEE